MKCARHVIKAWILNRRSQKSVARHITKHEFWEVPKKQRVPPWSGPVSSVQFGAVRSDLDQSGLVWSDVQSGPDPWIKPRWRTSPDRLGFLGFFGSFGFFGTVAQFLQVNHLFFWDLPSRTHVLLHGGIPFFGTSHVEFMLLIDGGCVSTASDSFLSQFRYDQANLAPQASGRKMQVFHWNLNTNQAHIRSGPVGCGQSCSAKLLGFLKLFVNSGTLWPYQFKHFVFVGNGCTVLTSEPFAFLGPPI